MDLTCNNICYSIKNKLILSNDSVSIKGNKFFTILGPNGCGKTTLLKTIYRVLKPSSGTILLNGNNIEHISLKASAKELAVVAQFNEINFDCNVKDMVMLGRTPHLSFMRSEKQSDYDIMEDALQNSVLHLPVLLRKNLLYFFLMSLPTTWISGIKLKFFKL